MPTVNRLSIRPEHPAAQNSSIQEAQYNATGWKLGLDPNAGFSTVGYLASNADVKAAGINPLDHYWQYGWKEGRDPSAERAKSTQP